MDNKITYTKLSSLVGDTFTVEKAGGFQWKRWDNESKKMLISEQYQEGFQKKYTIDTDKGRLDLGSGQLSSLLEGFYSKGVSDINGKTFSVKSNGKTGMDIRYYLNPVREPHTNQDQSNFDQMVAKKNELKAYNNEQTEKDKTLSDEEEDLLSQIPF